MLAINTSANSEGLQSVLRLHDAYAAVNTTAKKQATMTNVAMQHSQINESGCKPLRWHFLVHSLMMFNLNIDMLLLSDKFLTTKHQSIVSAVHEH